MDKCSEGLDELNLTHHPLTNLHLHIERYGALRLDKSWKAKNRLILESKIYYVTSGSAHLMFDDCSFHLIPEKIYFFPENTRQSFYTDEEFELHWMHFHCTLLGGIDLSQCFGLQNEIPQQKIPDITALLAAIRKEHTQFRETNHPCFLLCAHARIMKILSSFILPSKKSSYGKDFERLKKAVQFIEENIYRPICIRELAALCGFERAYFSTLFRKTFGCSPQEFINRSRIRHILPLLHQEHLLIEEIAAQSGFQDAYYFSRFFKKNTGLSPTEYRRTHREATP